MAPQCDFERISRLEVQVGAKIMIPFWRGPYSEDLGIAKETSTKIIGLPSSYTCYMSYSIDSSNSPEYTL